MATRCSASTSELEAAASAGSAAKERCFETTCPAAEPGRGGSSCGACERVGREPASSAEANATERVGGSRLEGWQCASSS